MEVRVVNAVVLAMCLTGMLAHPLSASADGCLQRNPPGSTEGETKSPCGCSGNGGDDAEVSDGCIKVMLGMGHSTPWTGSQPLALKVFADDSSPMVFTPDSLYPIMGYTFKRLGNAVLSDGVTAAEVVFSHPNGEPVHFVFKEGESLGRPDPGVHVPMDERLQMVDAQGWATDHDPVYWDLYETDGSVRRFLASDLTGRRGSLVSVTDSRGLVTTPDDMGVDLVYGPDGVRQFLAPARLADVRVVDGGYDVAIYPLRAVPEKDPATGLYPVPDVPTHRFLSVRSANGGKQAVVTLKTGASDPKRYVFDYVSGDWSLTRPNGVREIKDRVTDDSSRARLSKEIRSPDDTILSKSVMNYKWEAWGYAMTNKVEGFGGVTQTTSWTYYTSGGGKGKVRTSFSPTGLLTEYMYDAEGRELSIRRSGPDMMTEVTTYSYTSVDPADIVPPVDTRPRTVVKTLDGIECERTYYVYSPLTNIVERVGTQGAAYGGTNVLRTVTEFYPVVGTAVSAVRAGRIKSLRHEDGRLDLYDYDLTTNLWSETVTHLHEQSPEPVSGKTTRDTTLTNRRGETVERKTEAFIDGSWYTISRDRMTYNTTGKRIRNENLAGQATVTDWDCCHKVSETGPDGSTTTWDYDDEGRMIASSRLIPLDLTNVTWVTTSYAYDDLDRQTATWTTNYTAHIGTPATTTSYDALGRVIARTDVLGNATTTSFSPDGRTVSVREPNGATTITSRNPDGDALSITGSAVTPSFTTRGVLADGTRWTKTVQGENDSSPRYTCRYENMLGQTVREERSGFGGAVLAAVNTYDGYGRLVSTTSDGEPTSEYSYDAFGERIVTTHTVGSRVPRDRDGEWRKAESSSAYTLMDGNVWLVQTNVTSCSDASIAPLATPRSVQLTGLTAANPARSLARDIRGNATKTWTEYADGFSIAKRRSPEASNVVSAKSRYGVSLETVSVSAVTNRTEYDALGRTVAQVDGRGNRTRTEYDTYGRRAASVDAAGCRTAYGYDALGQLVAVTNPMGEVVTYAYDLRGHKTYEGGATYPVSYAYDLFGNKVAMTTYRDEDAHKGDVTQWLYDEASGSMTNKVYADGKGTTYDYDARGHLTKRTWARGIDTTYTYDAWGNLVTTAYSDNTPPVSLTYDAMGRQTRAVDAAGTTTFVYDAFGSLTNETVIGVAGTNTIERFYDTFGRDVGYALNGVRQSTLGYDPATGRLTTMLAAGNETPFTWNYLDGSDLKSSLAYPNGLTVNWSYSNRGELLKVNNASPTDTISKYVYAYDAAGRRIGCDKSGSAFDTPDANSYRYNARSELTNATAAVDTSYRYSYDFDDIGNRETSSERGTNVAYAANNLNQYMSVDAFVPQYDEDGNQTLVKTATGVWQVTYNCENRPILWTHGTNTISMTFDRFGRRVSKNGRHFAYSGYRQIADNGGNAYVWDPSEPVATKPLCFRNSTENLAAYYLHDGNKNVTDLIRGGPQNDCLAHYEYAPFGRIFKCRGSFAARNPWRYSSEYADDETSTVYYNFRHYVQSLGRWLNRDLIGVKGGANEYAYLKNSVAGYDQLGLSCYGGDWGDFGSLISSHYFGGAGPCVPPYGQDPNMIPSSESSSGEAEISLAAYYVIGGSVSSNVGVCCQNGSRYRWVTITTCVGMGIGAKIPSIPSVSKSTNSECPPEGTIYTIGTGFDLPVGTLGAEAETFGVTPQDGFYCSNKGCDVRDVGDFYRPSIGLSLAWRFFDICSTMRVKFERID